MLLHKSATRISTMTQDTEHVRATRTPHVALSNHLHFLPLPNLPSIPYRALAPSILRGRSVVTSPLRLPSREKVLMVPHPRGVFLLARDSGWPFPRELPSQSAFSPPSSIFSRLSSRYCPGFLLVLRRRDREQCVYLSFPEADTLHAF